MSTRALRTIINIAGIICGIAFIAVRVEPVFNLLITEKILPGYWENWKYGELYYDSRHISHFREDLPPYSPELKYRFTERHPSLEEADVVIFGDSFMDFSRFETFPEKLGKATDKKVAYVRDDVPLLYLYNQQYENSESKLAIYETAERFLAQRFNYAPRDDYNWSHEKSALKEFVKKTIDFIFPEQMEANYKMLMARSYVTTDTYTAINTAKFNWLGTLSSQTPKYTLEYDTPWVFGNFETSNTPRGFYYQHTQAEIDNICDNIKLTADLLKKNYNFDFVFMPIPSKYTIYHGLINNDMYNNFIPRLYAGLEERGVEVIKLYDTYKKSNDVLYLGTDTHWNELGIDLALNEAISTINPKLSSDLPQIAAKSETNTQQYQLQKLN